MLGGDFKLGSFGSAVRIWNGVGERRGGGWGLHWENWEIEDLAVWERQKQNHAELT